MNRSIPMNIPSYSPDYLSGYSSEIYTVDLKDAHRCGENPDERHALQYGGTGCAAPL